MLHHYKKQGLGTHWHISYQIDSDHRDSEIGTMIDTFEARYSRFNSMSLISKLNTEKTLTIDDEFLDIIQVGYQAALQTGGMFSPFLGGVLENLGYDATYSFLEKQNKGHVGTTCSIEGNTVYLGEDTTFDIGGYGKGYLIDRIAGFFLEKNISNRIINGGGDIRFQRKDEQYKNPIVIPHPHTTGLAIAERECTAGAIATSSAIVRKRGNNHHLIDPVHKSSVVNTIQSVSTLSTSACLADIAATTLYVGGKDNFEKLSTLFGVGYVVVSEGDIVTYTQDSKGLTVFTY